MIRTSAASLAKSAQLSFMAPRSLPAMKHNSNAKAFFSSECAPAMKLRCIFEEYRAEHFSREIPSRFRKEVTKVIARNGQVTVDSFNILLTNIGREEARLSEAELEDLLIAAGVHQSNRKISVEQAMQLL